MLTCFSLSFFLSFFLFHRYCMERQIYFSLYYWFLSHTSLSSLCIFVSHINNVYFFLKGHRMCEGKLMWEEKEKEDEKEKRGRRRERCASDVCWNKEVSTHTTYSVSFFFSFIHPYSQKGTLLYAVGMTIREYKQDGKKENRYNNRRDFHPHSFSYTQPNQIKSNHTTQVAVV